MIGPLDLSKYIADDWIDIVRKRNQDIINDEEYSHDDNPEFVDEVGDQESDATKENEKLEEKIVEKITEKIEKSQLQNGDPLFSHHWLQLWLCSFS